jgi:hypothetical protein
MERWHDGVRDLKLDRKGINQRHKNFAAVETN